MTKKYVYGSRHKKWYLVGPSDRDYKIGISKKEFEELGSVKALKKWNQGAFIK
jgi:hypothetical protein